MRKSKKRNRKAVQLEKTSLLAVVFAVVVLCAIGGLLWLTLGSRVATGQPKVIGTVNTMPFYEDELAMYAAEERAAVAGEVAARHALDSFGDRFWETEYDGVTPRQLLYERALATLVRNKVIQQQAMARGIVAPASYAELLAALPASQTDATGPTIGMEPAEYNSYLMTYAIDDLKAALLENELAPSEAEERTAFASLPESLRQEDFSVSGVVFRWEEGEESPKAALEALLTGEISPERLPETLEQAVRSLAANMPELQWEPFAFASAEVHREDVSGMALADVLAPLPIGDMLELPEERTLYLLQHKQGGGLLTYEQAPNLGRNKWINDQFEIFIDEKVAEASVAVNRDAAKGI